ncbi:hypothetical protein GO730_00460 [Spirosoma sp. HMF3257]|uniref:Uncharacterized protein n=1 Tax=Spirosoma telluris TaxID=2183553 RepID=A0A327NEE3_9BACT|nr:hypothetical protein [Spirosoma telluris]RAI73275.1 hypothetical protein HMF3257_00450 [Spirosoma telluris]
MKTDDKNKPMVARQDNPRNTFKVQKPDAPQISDRYAEAADNLVQELSAEQAELDAVEQGLQERKQQLLAKAQQVADAVRKEKLETRAGLLEDAADWREIARTTSDPERAKDFLRKAKNAELEATRLGAELNLNESLPVSDSEKKPLLMISTNKAIWIIIGLFIGFVGMTYLFGAPLEADPMNAIGQSMMKNAPIRALLSFTLTFLTFLVAVFFIRVAFPQFYRIWHNRIDSERSLDSLLNEAPAWVVLACLFGLFFMFMQLFASFYQALYA